ncbi:MAG TPA: acyltransferase [Bryobacteraceae bacterium]|nr:acyltransferase [Bryobacteraceae bacterium]
MTPSATGSPSAAPAAAAKTGTRISELDGLRGIAILLVMFFHFTPRTGPLSFFSHLFQLGWTGVDLFFVLSGFLITGILVDTVGHRSYYRNFIVRRCLRIFPAYYMSLVVCCILTYYPFAPRWGEFLRAGGWWYVTYLGNLRVFLDSAWPGLAILTPLWSLQVEEQFYLSFPLLVWALERKTLAKVLAASVVLALALRIALLLAMPKNMFGVYTLMPCRMDALAMGGLIAIAQRERPEWLKSRWIGWMTLAAAATVAAIIRFYSNSDPWPFGMQTIGYTAIDLMFAGILIILVHRRQPVLLRICRWPFLVWVGTISYGLYLLHVPGEVIGRLLTAHLVRLAPSGSAEFLVSMVVTIALAWISWSVFESRILKLKDRFTVR